MIVLHGCWRCSAQVRTADSALRHADSGPQEAQDLLTSRGQKDCECQVSQSLLSLCRQARARKIEDERQ